MSTADVLPYTEAELNDHAKMALLVTKGIDIRTLFRLGEELGLSGQETADLLGSQKALWIAVARPKNFLGRKNLNASCAFCAYTRKPWRFSKPRRPLSNGFQRKTKR
jgi:hypothetical protein